MPILSRQPRAWMVIALARFCVVLPILAWPMIDRGSSNRLGTAALLLLLAYLAFAAAIGWLGSTDWWLEARLNALLFILDILFIAALLWPATHGASPASPLSAIACLAGALSLRLGASLIAGPGARRFRAAPAGARLRALDEIICAEPPVRLCLDLASENLSAKRVWLFLSEVDEPLLTLSSRADGVEKEERFAPDALPSPIDHLDGDRPFLFDCAKGRRLVHDGERVRPERYVEVFPAEIVRHCLWTRGIAIPVRSSRHEALLVADGIPRLGRDQLSEADRIGMHIAAAFERADRIAALQQVRITETRQALARNLHDGAAQFLAGLALKIRSIKDRVDDPAATRVGIDDIEAVLTRQQHELRGIIGNLRAPVSGSANLGLRRSLRSLAAKLEARWGVEVAVTDLGEDRSERQVTGRFRFQLDQMITEAASNAVRHGGASRLELGLAQEADGIRLDIADNGCGFGFTGTRQDEALWQQNLGPLSLHQRLRSLGGTLSIDSSPTGATLSLRIPLEQQP